MPSSTMQAQSRSFLSKCVRKPLILHFDINKTIIQVDPTGGRTMEDVLNSNAAANVMGKVDHSGAWIPLYGPHDTPFEPEGGSKLISYTDYVDEKWKAPPGMDSLSAAEKDTVWRQVSAGRRKAVRDFTHPGGPGHAYASLVEEQLAHLRVRDGEYHSIIPAFFQTINYLSQEDWPFVLIFRTFGSDLSMVLEEWKRFILGEHHCKPQGNILRRMREEYKDPHCGCVFRRGDAMLLVLGPNVSASHLPLSGLPLAEVETALHSLPGFKTLKTVTFHDLPNELISMCAGSNNVGGLVDYYPNWAQGAESRHGGKVFAVEVENAKNYHIFFDDNIFVGDEHSIVDLRDASDPSRPITDAEIERRFCVHVNAFRAITDEDYFLKCLDACCQLQQH